MMQSLRNSRLAANALWLAISVLLALGVWYIAATSADPITQRRFTRIPITFLPSQSAEMVDSALDTVDVSLVGSQSVVSSRRGDDIAVRADLSALGPGTHSLPLQVEVIHADGASPRRILAQVRPEQITVELEAKAMVDKRVDIALSPPPIGFKNDAPQLEFEQVAVSGAASRVARVVAAQGTLDISSSRNPLEVDLPLQAVDADGQRVDGVELEPQRVSVALHIQRREDIRQIAVRPNVLFRTLPPGYAFKEQSYEPESLFISGPSERLSEIADTLLTEPISLVGREEGFVTIVPVQLPADDLFVMGGDSKVTVSIDIIPIIVSRQIDSIPAEPIGLAEGYDISVVPRSVAALISGPVAVVQSLSAENILVQLDLQGLTPGVYDLAPTVSIIDGDFAVDDVSLSPAELNVEIREPSTPEPNTSETPADA